MDATLFLTGCVVAVTAYYYYRSRYNRTWQMLAKIPGPTIWPIIGNLHFLDRSIPWNKTWHMAKKYGPVMRLQMGELSYVMLNSKEAIYEGLVTKGKQLLTRPMLPRVAEAVPDFQSVIFSESNDHWKTLRRSFLLNFKYYGSGKSHLEPIILEILEDLKTTMRGTAGKPVDPRPMIYRYFSSIMHVLNFGSKPKSQDFFDNIEVYDQELIRHLNPFGDGIEYDVWSWYRKLGLGQGLTKRLRFVAEQTSRLWSNYGVDIKPDPNTPAFDYDEGRIREPCYAATLQAIVNNNRDKGFVEQHARGSVADTFIGGLTTSTMSMHFLFNILLHYPEVQDKLHEEIDRVLGDNKEAMITTDMKGEMHYLQATLYELLRYTSILPFGLPHVTQQDVDIQGYVIPEGTIVMMHTWYLHHDDHWDEPFKFKPGRYLDEEGKFVSADHPNRKHWMPFGAGHRVCGGMVLALNRYFLTIGNLLRHFHISPVPGKELTTCNASDGKHGIFIHGQDYNVRFIERSL